MDELVDALRKDRPALADAAPPHPPAAAAAAAARGDADDRAERGRAAGRRRADAEREVPPPPPPPRRRRVAQQPPHPRPGQVVLVPIPEQHIHPPVRVRVERRDAVARRGVADPPPRRARRPPAPRTNGGGGATRTARNGRPGAVPSSSVSAARGVAVATTYTSASPSLLKSATATPRLPPAVAAVTPAATDASA